MDLVFTAWIVSSVALIALGTNIAKAVLGSNPGVSHTINKLKKLPIINKIPIKASGIAIIQ